MSGRFAIVTYGKAHAHAAYVENTIHDIVDSLQLVKNPEIQFPYTTGENVECMAYVMEQVGAADLAVECFKLLAHGSNVVAVRCWKGRHRILPTCRCWQCRPP